MAMPAEPKCLNRDRVPSPMNNLSKIRKSLLHSHRVVISKAFHEIRLKFKSAEEKVSHGLTLKKKIVYISYLLLKRTTIFYSFQIEEKYIKHVYGISLRERSYQKVKQ